MKSLPAYSIGSSLFPIICIINSLILDKVHLEVTIFGVTMDKLFLDLIRGDGILFHLNKLTKNYVQTFCGLFCIYMYLVFY